MRNRSFAVAITFAIALFSGAASAQNNADNGWYIGGYLYGVELRGSDEKLQVPADPGNSMTFPPVPATPAYRDSFHSQYDKDMGFGGVLGYDFAGVTRLELAVRQFENDIEEFSDSQAPPDVITGEAKSTAVIGNLWFDFNRDARWRPYIGFGVGAANIEKGDFDEDTFVKQVGLGVNVDLAKNWILDIGYRYMDADEVEYDTSRGELETEYTTNVLAFGLKYAFNSGPAPDEDGDGVPDANDKCPGTPPGRVVNADGCELDSDGDGVVNGDDACPNTEPGVEVMSNGCAVGQNTVLRGVNFEFDSATLTYEAEQILNGVAATLKSSPNFVVELQGHTDSYGSDAYNLNLSDRRAASVRRYLIGKGIAAERMFSTGYGESAPVAGNDTAQGRAENRRVELHTISDDAQARIKAAAEEYQRRNNYREPVRPKAKAVTYSADTSGDEEEAAAEAAAATSGDEDDAMEDAMEAVGDAEEAMEAAAADLEDAADDMIEAAEEVKEEAKGSAKESGADPYDDYLEDY